MRNITKNITLELQIDRINLVWIIMATVFKNYVLQKRI